MLIGDLKSLLPLWKNLARNRRYEPYIEEADVSEFEKRFTNEGLAFIAETLPLIGKALDSFHSTSEWIPPVGFTVREASVLTWIEVRYSDGRLERVGYYKTLPIPVFLNWAIRKALEGDSIAVDCVRQMTLIFYKLEVAYGKEKELKFLDQFKDTDKELDSVFSQGLDFQDRLIAEMRRLIGRVLCNEDPLDIVPSHGSGSTACRTLNWDKHHRPLQYYSKLDDVFPYSDYFFLNHSHLVDEMARLENSIPIAIPRARVCLVPKDSRGPRVISCEPAEFMFIQQGLMRKLYKAIETHTLTSGYVNFTNQTVNQELARRSSKGELELATIDLSDASDRVSLELVRRVFPHQWFRALEACRSEETVLPNSEVIKLNKFAPMGSSCCFPVEALLFWACAVATIRILGKIRHLPEVFVYGDDIITDSKFFEFVVSGLESIGLKVNANKSYWKGPFRESCGGDFHLGVNVTPVRVREFLSKSRTSIATNADLANLFVAKFGYADAATLVSVIETEGGYVYPRSELQLPAAILVTPGASNDVFFARRFNKSLQRVEHRILVLRPRSSERRPPNWEELFRKQLFKARSSNRQRIDFDMQPVCSRGNPLLGACPYDLAMDHRYENPLAIEDSKLKPGWYTEPHSVVHKWVWTWLG